MAYTIMNMPEAEMYAIASRSMDKAMEYKEKYHMKKAYDSYEALASDPEVDVVYIATPHSLHYEQAKMCLEYGKNVLCEKAFTINAKQAAELIRISEEKGLFLGEAMWTRFMPLIKQLKKLLESKRIGEVTHMTSNLNFPNMHIERLSKAELAGGALLDLGIYPLTMASVVMGDDIDYVKATGILTDEGVDKMGQYTIVYKNKTMADLNSGMCSFSDGRTVIYGTNGYILVEGTNHPAKIEVFDNHWTLVAQYEREQQITGYEYEVKACVEAVKNGKTQCEEMSHNQTLIMMKLMDEIREQMGVKYPVENT
jgi:predicted dehydrogenase